MRLVVILAMVLTGARPWAVAAAPVCTPRAEAVCCCEGGCEGCGCCVREPGPAAPEPEKPAPSQQAGPRAVATLPGRVTVMAVGWGEPMRRGAVAAAFPVHRGVSAQAALCVWRT